MNDKDIPLRMSREAAAQYRAAAIFALPHCMVQEIHDYDRLVRKIENVALELGDNLEDAQLADDPQWWRIQDMLDDVLDILTYVTKKGP